MTCFAPGKARKTVLIECTGGDGSNSGQEPEQRRSSKMGIGPECVPVPGRRT